MLSQPTSTMFSLNLFVNVIKQKTPTEQTNVKRNSIMTEKKGSLSVSVYLNGAKCNCELIYKQFYVSKGFALMIIAQVIAIIIKFTSCPRYQFWCRVVKSGRVLRTSLIFGCQREMIRCVNAWRFDNE